MRDGFNKVILANEVNGGLAEKVDHLTIATSHRVMVLEEKLK